MKGHRTVVMIVLGCLGVLLISVTVLRAIVTHDEHPACQRYSDLLEGNNNDLLAFSHAKQAQADFEAELKADPDAGCASKGLVLLSKRNCEAGTALAKQGLLARAEKVFVSELDSDPGLVCARTGLRQLADARCRIARALVKDHGKTDEAQAILKSTTLPDAPAICPGVVPQKAQSTTQQTAKTGG